MKAKVTEEFRGRPDDEPLARTIAEGEEITGELAAYAVGEKLAVEQKDDAPAARKGRKKAAS